MASKEAARDLCLQGLIEVLLVSLSMQPWAVPVFMPEPPALFAAAELDGASSIQVQRPNPDILRQTLGVC